MAGKRKLNNGAEASAKVSKQSKITDFSEASEKLPKETKLTEKLPKETKSTEKLPKKTKSTEKLPKETKSTEKLPKETKSTEKLPEQTKSTDVVPENQKAEDKPTSVDHKYKIISWNVNGIRAWKGKDGFSIIKSENPDIFCVQETKCGKSKMVEEGKYEGYKSYYMSAEKEGYSGVALYSKTEPLSVAYGMGDKEQDSEGRSLTAEYPEFYVVNAYVKNSGQKLKTLPQRMDWDKKFLAYLKGLEEKKPVILCGDLNVAHLEIDLANPKTNRRNAGFTKEERDNFTLMLGEGFIDSFRTLYPDKTKAYTFWTYMANARAKNVGWRLDYFVLSKALEERLADNVIFSDVMGSDHCPIMLLLK